MIGPHITGIDIVTNIMSYKKRFADDNTYSLLKEAHTLSKNQNKSWMSKCKNMGHFILETANKDPFILNAPEKVYKI